MTRRDDPGRIRLKAIRFAVERADPLTRQLENFCAVIRGTGEPVVSARDGLQNLRVLEAIQRAARSGQASTVAQ